MFRFCTLPPLPVGSSGDCVSNLHFFGVQGVIFFFGSSVPPPRACWRPYPTQSIMSILWSGEGVSKKKSGCNSVPFPALPLIALEILVSQHVYDCEFPTFFSPNPHHKPLSIFLPSPIHFRLWIMFNHFNHFWYRFHWIRYILEGENTSRFFSPAVLPDVV